MYIVHVEFIYACSFGIFDKLLNLSYPYSNRNRNVHRKVCHTDPTVPTYHYSLQQSKSKVEESSLYRQIGWVLIHFEKSSTNFLDLRCSELVIFIYYWIYLR